MTHIMDGMVRRDRIVDGKNTSLCDVGYCDIGVDYGWYLSIYPIFYIYIYRRSYINIQFVIY